MDRRIIKARDIMHTNYLELDGMATVSEALEAMRSERSHLVVVRKRHEHDAFGIVVLADIAKKVLARDRSAKRTNVYEIMSKPVIQLDPEMDVRYCARLYDRFGLSNAPVVEDGRVIGIVSYQELVFEGLYPLMD
jgi:CBS domain-containing protein